jgi:16S rRNA processing protein RimM
VSDRVCVAKIGAAHGIRGEVKLWSFTADPLAVKDYGPLETEDGSASFTLEMVRPAKDHLVVRLSGVRDRNAAERLTNISLFVPRTRLPPTSNDEFYHADLIGLMTTTADGQPFGTVVAVHNFGAGDILELRRPGERATVMLPFSDMTVPIVDIAAGRVVINPPVEVSGEDEPGKGPA